MLVLNRKTGEQILIGDSIVLTVVEIRGASIRLGIKAPHEVPIMRKEITDDEGPGSPASPK